MPDPRSAFVRTVVERGFLHQCTDIEALDALAGERPLTAYIGFDCTAPSLHVGSLVSIMLLRRLQQAGHRPIVLMGGGTTRIGDPTGRDEARKLLSDADIATNMAGIRQVFARFLDFGDGPAGATMVNNADWLDGLAYIPFLRDFGRHFSVNRMLTFDSVKLRLEREQPLSFLEFNYMVLQAYDFLELARRRDCALQMGGSDQWGNIVAGCELARRVDGRTLFGLTTPLITTASGAKLPLATIEELESLQGAAINDAKVVLADEATRLCHGEAARAAAAETARATFAEEGAGEALPTIDISRDELAGGLPAFELFRRAGLAASGGEARRLIKGGGARLNNVLLAEETRAISLADADPSGRLKLSAGEKRHALVRIV